MLKTWMLSATLAAGLLPAGPAAAADADACAVRGTATFRERIALPPGAVFEATLEDVSRADAPADVLARFTREQPGNPPYGFELACDTASIVPSRRYVVRARITLAGRLLFTTDRAYPVLTQDSPARVELVLVRVAGAAGRAGTGKPGDLFATLPATFTGVLPCADCPGIEHQLDLLPDGSYALRTRYLGRGAERALDDIGRWALSSDGVTLALKGGKDEPVYFSIEDADTLRKLDRAGGRIDSQLDYELHRAGQYVPLEPDLAMRGMFRYLADAAGFTECATGWRLPVAMEGAYRELERAYLDAPRAGAPEPAPLMAMLEGRIARRSPMEGPQPVPTLVVEHFDRVVPGESCPPLFATAELADTAWTLVALDGAGLVPVDERAAPQLVLQAADQRAVGSDGCNRFFAGYTLEADRIAFTPAASTRKACPGAGDLAERFGQALVDTSHWRVLGRQLELYDAAGRLRAKFQAGEPP